MADVYYESMTIDIPDAAFGGMVKRQLSVTVPEGESFVVRFYTTRPAQIYKATIVMADGTEQPLDVAAAVRFYQTFRNSYRRAQPRD